MADEIFTSAGAGNEEKLTVLRRAVQQEHARIDAIVAEKKKEVGEYKTLMKRLEDLPKKLQHHIMVPFGSVGFMPGKIIRTNEVMMLVGDGYFVERSCFEANETLQRRLDMVNQVFESCEKERKLVNDQLQFAERLFANKSSENGEVEIREEYDEEKEAEFKRKRLERIRDTTSYTAKTEEKANDVMSRLEELEALEAQNGELDGEAEEEEAEDEEGKTEDADPAPPPGVSKEDFRRLLARLDEDSSSEEESDAEENTKAIEKKNVDLDSDDLPEEDEEEEPSPLMKEVASKALRKRSVTFASNIEVKTDIRAEDPVSAIKTATELVPGRTNSILRNKDAKSPCDEDALAAMKEKENRPRVMPGSLNAFSGMVVERQPIEEYSLPDGCFSQPGPSSAEAPKRVSKFKRQRAKN